jgi:hypothetical protein
LRLLPSPVRADSGGVRMFVAVVICAVLALPAWASASSAPSPLVRTASRLSGLAARGPVRTSTVSARRYDALLARARNRDYPASLQRTDASIEALLGLTTRSTSFLPARAWYDVAAQRLFLQRRPAAPRSSILNELVRALVDQNYGLRRLTGLRARDHDRWLAARGIVDGTAALASGLRPTPLRGTPLDRFTQLEASVGTGPGRTLAAQLRSIGGNAAVASALRTFPQTTEQLLHIDKFLEREPALPVHLPQRAGPATLESAETFGELDVLDLLQAFGVPSSVTAADGWGGGGLALYGDGGDRVAVIVLRWDSPDDVLEWQAAVPRYVAAAFPGAVARTCPPLDRCWSGSGELAAGVLGTTSVLASGPDSAGVAAALLTLK